MLQEKEKCDSNGGVPSKHVKEKCDSNGGVPSKHVKGTYIVCIANFAVYCLVPSILLSYHMTNDNKLITKPKKYIW